MSVGFVLLSGAKKFFFPLANGFFTSAGCAVSVLHLTKCHAGRSQRTFRS